MRHVIANLAVYVLASGLVLAAVLFAWARSNQLTLTTERALEPREWATVTTADAFDWRELGERTYVANCQNCHGAKGQGLDRYPGVIGTEALLAADGGREYLVHLVLYGARTGRHPAPMPPMPTLSDAQVAAVNNHLLTHFGEAPAGDALFIPSEVRDERGLRLSERDVGARRPAAP
jgi:mono/diheme cytochrome c family protein